MDGCKEEVESVHARCSIKWLAGSKTMMTTTVAYCSGLASLGGHPGIQGKPQGMDKREGRLVGPFGARFHAIGGIGCKLD